MTVGRGMRKEFNAVRKHWGPDWFGMGVSRKFPGTVLYATMYTLCYSIITSASFGYKYKQGFVGSNDTPIWSVTTSFLSGGVTGIIMALISGQPLVVYGQTGPILLLYAYVYKLTIVIVPDGKTIEDVFLPMVAWIGLFAGLMHFALALFNTCDLKNKITPFTDQIFACLVAGDFVTTAVLGFANGFGATPPGEDSAPEYSSAALLSANGFFTLLLGIAFYALTIRFGGLQTRCRWSSVTVLRILSNYSVLWSLVILTIVSYIPSWAGFPGFPAHSDYADAPPQRIAGHSNLTYGIGQLAGTDYMPFLRMGEVPASGIALSVLFAFLLTTLFYVDQNISTIFACNGQPWGKVRSPECYNLDFFFVGITCIITGFMGLPASSGLIPQNPMHTRSLSLVVPGGGSDGGQHLRAPALEGGSAFKATASQSLEVDHPRALAKPGVSRPSYAAASDTVPEETCVVEQRISALLHSVLLFCVIFVMPLIGYIPVGLLWGGYLLLASEAFGTTFVQRILACLSSTNMRESLHDNEALKGLLDQVSYSTMLRFTLIQFGLWLLLFVIGVVLKELVPFNKENIGHIWVMIGMFFPVIVLLYAIPVRSHLITKCFEPAELCCLDHEDEGEEHGRHSIAGQSVSGAPSVTIRTCASNSFSYLRHGDSLGMPRVSNA